MTTKAVSIAKDKIIQPEPDPSEKRASEWEELMRKFSESHKSECKSIALDIPRVARSKKTFPTGSEYEGTWNALGMSGYGAYTFPNGVHYEGEFEDGLFDGLGELRYQNGTIVRGKWKNGVLGDRTLIFDDGLEYSEFDWKYCKIPDRRFTIEYKNGVQPAGRSYMTAEQPTREIPLGHYDAGDGFYCPKTKVVYKTDDITAIMRSPSKREQKWIVENCRYNPDVTIGPRPDLYDKWLKPRQTLEVPPKPAVDSRITGPRFRTQSMFEQDHEVEIKFRNLEEDTTGSSSSSD